MLVCGNPIIILIVLVWEHSDASCLSRCRRLCKQGRPWGSALMAAALAASRTGSAKPGRAPLSVPGSRSASLRHTQQPARCDVMSNIGGEVERHKQHRRHNDVRPNSCTRTADSGVGKGEGCVATKNQDVSATARTNAPGIEATAVKNGLLWQKWDKFFSRWKERFFVLTKDYLACFKKEHQVGTTKKGKFICKVNLTDVEDVHWGDKNRHGLIVLRFGTKKQLLLRTGCDLYGWMIALRDTISRSKKRLEARRNAQMIGEQACDAVPPKRQPPKRQHKSTSTNPQPLSFLLQALISFKLVSLSHRAAVPTSVASAAHERSCIYADRSGKRPGHRQSLPSHPRQHSSKSSDPHRRSSRPYTLTTSKFVPLAERAPARTSVASAARHGGDGTARRTAYAPSHSSGTARRTTYAPSHSSGTAYRTAYAPSHSTGMARRTAYAPSQSSGTARRTNYAPSHRPSKRDYSYKRESSSVKSSGSGRRHRKNSRQHHYHNH